ncbi:hypothetical protein O6H91_12G053700 [Diphasiastrum complanatum]|uniref:Uncharacterized protein n=1 Tax=Diphasiastrum complanatum TaxID=34168 RepID=A0ACC2C1S4_DIPCM|nr:hypothetical protein O6H91_12G053700 [Diphasiastrum complanatum]
MLGYCQHESERILIYEYMVNGSLDEYIFKKNGLKSLLLTLEKRFHVALHVANALAYLHEGCSMFIIHRDIKPQNILLNEELEAKVCDFDLAKVLDHNKQSRNELTRIRGTLGYMAPECRGDEIEITEKVDVYSFGIVLLEMISGTKNTDFSITNFKEKAHSRVTNNGIMELVDETLSRDANPEQVRKMVFTALCCVQVNSSERPTMSDAIKYLNGESKDIPQPPIGNFI